ncbi:hypothetical protein [Paenibacillus chartarius]
MVKSWKAATTATLLLSLAFGAYGSAAAETVSEAKAADVLVQEGQGEQASADKGPEEPVRLSARLLLNPVHERTYLQLLVQAYDPERAGEWQAALDERKQVESEMPKPQLGTKQIVLKHPAAGQEGVGVPLRIEIKHDDLHSLPQQPQPFKLPELGANGEFDVKVELPAELKLQEDLAKALEAGDTDAVKELLPQLLDSYRKMTSELKQLAEKLKQEPAPAAAPNPSADSAEGE